MRGRDEEAVAVCFQWSASVVGRVWEAKSEEDVWKVGAWAPKDLAEVPAKPARCGEDEEVRKKKGERMVGWFGTKEKKGKKTKRRKKEKILRERATLRTGLTTLVAT